jgi:MFS family permease
MKATEVSPPKFGRFGLYVLLAGQLLSMIDFSIVNVALNAIAQSLHANDTALELLVAGYGVAFAVFLAMGGRLGDNFGRRRIFHVGVALFGVASLLCGLAESIWLLLAARALQGIGAALTVPQVLATIHVALSGPKHSRAIGLYGAIGGLAFIVGQVLGGFLISSDFLGMGWRSVFLINLPICVAVLIASPQHIPETRREKAAHVDLPGTVLLGLLILCLLLPLSLGPVLHWSWPCLTLLMASLPLAALLLRTEARLAQRGEHPLLPPSLLRLSSIRFGLLVAVLFFASWGGFMFVLARVLQAGAGLSPIQSGNAFVALGASYFVASMFSARVVRRLGLLTTLLTGCTIQMSGLAGVLVTLGWIWPHPGVLNLLPTTALIGIGQAFIVSCFFRIGLADVSANNAGAASAMLSTVQQASLGLGPALLGAILTHYIHHGSTYLYAAKMALSGELLLMLVLVVSTLLHRHRQHRLSLVSKPCVG